MNEKEKKSFSARSHTKCQSISPFCFCWGTDPVAFWRSDLWQKYTIVRNYFKVQDIQLLITSPIKKEIYKNEKSLENLANICFHSLFDREVYLGQYAIKNMFMKILFENIMIA